MLIRQLLQLPQTEKHFKRKCRELLAAEVSANKGKHQWEQKKDEQIEKQRRLDDKLKGRQKTAEQVRL